MRCFHVPNHMSALTLLHIRIHQHDLCRVAFQFLFLGMLPLHIDLVSVIRAWRARSDDHPGPADT